MSTNNKPLVSILVPVYGTEKYIEQCAKSILAQDYDNLEVIFVDDKTPDKSIDLLRRTVEKSDSQIKNKIRIIQLEQNRGLPGVRNVLLDNARGEYISFVDSDDYLSPDAISSMMDVAISNNADMVKANFTTFSDAGMIREYDTRIPVERNMYINAMLDWCSISPSIWGKIYKRSIFVENDIRFIEGHNMGEDFGGSCKIAYYLHRICQINKSVYFYRINPESISRNFSKKHADDLIIISDSIFRFYKDKPDFALFEKSLEQGRYKIKTYILSQPNMRRGFKHIFSELDKCPYLTIKDRLRLKCAETNLVLYKLVSKIL